MAWSKIFSPCNTLCTDSRCLLWKFSAIRVTRWLLWHPNCIKFNFGGASPRTSLGELTTLPRPPCRLGRGKPPPHSLYPLDAFGVSLSTPSASNPRRLWRLDSNPSLRISSYATGTRLLFLSATAELYVFSHWTTVLRGFHIKNIVPLTCVSLRPSAEAISMRLARVRYLLKWNSFSSSVSCLLVKFVRPRLDWWGWRWWWWWWALRWWCDRRTPSLTLM